MVLTLEDVVYDEDIQKSSITIINKNRNVRLRRCTVGDLLAILQSCIMAYEKRSLSGSLVKSDSSFIVEPDYGFPDHLELGAVAYARLPRKPFLGFITREDKKVTKIRIILMPQKLGIYAANVDMRDLVLVEIKNFLEREPVKIGKVVIHCNGIKGVGLTIESYSVIYE